MPPETPSLLDTVRDRTAAAGLAWLTFAVVSIGVIVIRDVNSRLQDFVAVLGSGGLLIYLAVLLPVLIVESLLCLVAVPGRRLVRLVLTMLTLLVVSPTLCLYLVSAEVGGLWLAIPALGPPIALLGWGFTAAAGRLPTRWRLMPIGVSLLLVGLTLAGLSLGGG